jgi:transcriptional regulator with XRE-family HTH domain
MKPHDRHMPQLNGSKVRATAAEHGWKLSELATVTGIPYGTLRNTTRDGRPDSMRMPRVHKLRIALGLSAAEILANNEGVPDEPPKQPAKPAGAARRQDTEKTRKAPKRATERAA